MLLCVERTAHMEVERRARRWCQQASVMSYGTQSPPFRRARRPGSVPIYTIYLYLFYIENNSTRYTHFPRVLR